MEFKGGTKAALGYPAGTHWEAGLWGCHLWGVEEMDVPWKAGDFCGEKRTVSIWLYKVERMRFQSEVIQVKWQYTVSFIYYYIEFAEVGKLSPSDTMVKSLSWRCHCWPLPSQGWCAAVAAECYHEGGRQWSYVLTLAHPKTPWKCWSNKLCSLKDVCHSFAIKYWLHDMKWIRFWYDIKS